MAQQITPITPALPSTTAIQDPAVRRFAQAMQDALNALQSSEGAVASLSKAAAALSGAAAGGVPPSIAQWLFSSELYQKLTEAIASVDVAAKQGLLDEAYARQSAIDEINATLADIGSTAAYDAAATYQIGDMVTYDGKLYRAIAETTGNLPTNTTYWQKVGDYATLGDVVAAHTLQIADLDSTVSALDGSLIAEISERNALATQVRGTYSGTDINLVSQGLLYSERVARSTADSTEVAARQSLSAKLTGANDPTGLTINTLTSGLIFEEKQARASADGAMASSIDALEARTDATEAAIVSEQTVRANNDNALVTAINTAWSMTGATQAVKQVGSNLVTNWTTAQANKWSQLESEVFTANGKTIRAALAEEATVRANQTGALYAQYTVKLDTNGYVAGFGLASESTAAGNDSKFIIRADKFALVMPGYGDYVPFAIGPSGASFSGATEWAKVGGANRPADNATVGANSSNLKAGLGVNMVFNGDYTDGLAGTVVGWRSGGGQHTLGLNGSGYTVQGEGTAYITQPGNAGTGVVFDANIWNGREGQYFAVTPGKRYEFSAWLNCHRCSGHIIAFFHDAAGNQVWAPAGNTITYQSAISSIADMRQSWSIVTAPANAVKAFIIVRGTNIGSNDPYVFFSRVYFGEAGGGQTEPSPWSPGRGISQITSSNVSTYIANAAIGNAQIGGNIQSTNWSGWGGTGWLLDRAGNFYGNNIYARGDIQASSVTANSIYTSSINDEQITAIRYATSPTQIALTNNAWNTILSYSSFPAGSAGGVILFIKLALEGRLSGGSWVSWDTANSVRVLRNGVVLVTLSTGLYDKTLYDVPGGAATYEIQVYRNSGIYEQVRGFREMVILTGKK